MAAEVRKLMLIDPVQGSAQAKKMIETSAEQARAAMEKSMEQATKAGEGFFKFAEEAAEFGRGNFEAFTKASQALTVGLQDLGRQYFAVAQGLSDQALENARALAAVKSVKEAADLQTAYAKAAFERSVAETVKLNEASYRLAEQAFAPLAARASVAAEKLGRPLAA
jgi:phasin family protein